MLFSDAASYLDEEDDQLSSDLARVRGGCSRIGAAEGAPAEGAVARREPGRDISPPSGHFSKLSSMQGPGALRPRQ